MGELSSVLFCLVDRSVDWLIGCCCFCAFCLFVCLFACSSARLLLLLLVVWQLVGLPFVFVCLLAFLIFSYLIRPVLLTRRSEHERLITFAKSAYQVHYTGTVNTCTTVLQYATAIESLAVKNIWLDFVLNIRQMHQL